MDESTVPTEHTEQLRAEVERLNRPMVARLRKCAADTSSNWDGRIAIYPPEARGLVALIDAAAAEAAGRVSTSEGEDC